MNNFLISLLHIITYFTYINNLKIIIFKFFHFVKRDIYEQTYAIYVMLYHLQGRVYGYYADVANDCQLFHVCYPVAYPDGQEEMIKWSFICPNGTIFDQVNF